MPMELAVPVPDGEIWAEDAGGDGTPLVLLHPDGPRRAETPRPGAR
jgi:hypothetical protein